ncbi:NRAMP family divalent metal transporter [Pseudomonas sp. F1_0610]|uniref:NRAMP family divalent metal transporter n=1 Tax=Pseudomonas sp. F1_0610 TaxID=3114284 RepID=UPI0039C23810
MSEPNVSTASRAKLSVMLGAIFMMATSSIGPAFLTQTSKFTQEFAAAFAFAIVISILIDIFAQMNIWRVISVSGMRAQDIANRVFPGAGVLLSSIIVLGGLAFNIGNVGGAGLALQVIFGIPVALGAIIAGVLVIILFMLRNAMSVMDFVVQVLGVLMLVLIGYVMIESNPPYKEALVQSIAPDDPGILIFAIITLVGGTVGGYIPFSGGHRLVEAGITGIENVKRVSRASITGIATIGVVRICLFLATLGVVSQGFVLDTDNPAASVFQHALGFWGYKAFGVVLLAAAVSSIIGCAYTSVSFIQSWHSWIKHNHKYLVIAFICISTLVFALVGRPVKVLIIAGTINAIVLPVGLLCILLAAHNKKIVGDQYKHPLWLDITGYLTVAVSFVGFYFALEPMINLWHS